MCPIARAHFLRSTALAALAGIAGAELLTGPAFAGTIDTITPAQSHGGVLTYALPATDGVWIDAGNRLIVARVKNAVYALSLICPHRAVTTLDWVPESNEFHCPKHGANFQADGELIDGRPDRAMDRYAIRRSGGSIAIDTAALYQQDTSHDAWARAFVAAA
jgi:nitrite reductase/ring-hydroxylating ferredoxin subunit